MSVLAFDDVHKSYGGTPALRGVSFEVRPGEVFGLLGPNGAGKTTLIRIGLDIVRADAGEVALFDGPVDRERLDRVGYLPEERGLYRRQRVREVLGYFGALKGLRRSDAEQRADWWLERIGLPGLGSERIDRLSKGMSQKAQIAATLLPEPDLCILDEPFSGLDPVNGRLVKDLIAERREAGRATILSTHRMMEVQALCDRVAMVHRGRLVLYGPVDEVRESHSHPLLRVGLEGELPSLEGLESVSREPDGTYGLRLEQGVDPTDVLGALVQRGARVTHFERVLAPLEQVFIDVVRREEEAAA